MISYTSYKDDINIPNVWMNIPFLSKFFLLSIPEDNLDSIKPRIYFIYVLNTIIIWLPKLVPLYSETHDVIKHSTPHYSLNKLKYLHYSGPNWGEIHK